MKENSLFKKNLEIIKRCDNLLYDELIKYDLQSYKIENIDTEIALDGTKIVKALINQHEWYFNSKYNAKEIAKQWVNKLGKIESTSVITMFGLGNGIYLKEIMDRSYQSVIFIIYEPSLDIFLKVMNEIDFSFLDERVYISIEGINDNYFEAYFQAFMNFSNLSVCKFLCHPNYFGCFKSIGNKYLQKVKMGLTVLEAYINTDIRLSESYYQNTLKNMMYLAEASILEQIAKAVGKTIPEGLPAIIVSAGPSLKKNIKELKRAKNRAFIIATDTALKGLMAEDIIPDVFVTVDSAKNQNKFEDSRIDYIPTICFETARHINLSKHKGKKIFMNDKCGYGNELYKSLGFKYQYWCGGSSVATNAYAIAMAMGFKTIILVGQDLAYTNNERHYERGLGSSCFEKNENENDNLFLEVEDIYGDKIYTSKDFKIYLDWFEVEIGLHNDIDTIDATEGGAKIRGTRIISLETAINENCNVEFNMEEYMKNVPPLLDETERKKLFQLINEIPSQYEELLKDIEKGVELYTELIIELEKIKSDSLILLNLSKQIGKIMEKIEPSKAYRVTQYKLKAIEYTTLKNLGNSCDDATDDALEVAKRGIVMMESLRRVLVEVILEVKQNIDKIVETN